MDITKPLTAEELAEAARVRASVIALDLSRPAVFDTLSLAQFAQIYNGYGPDDWPASIRAAISHIYEQWLELAGVHDTDFNFSDGTVKGWREATARWEINISIMLDSRYPLRKIWLWPVRTAAWLKLRASYRALQLGSWGAWTAAHQRRLAGSMPV